MMAVQELLLERPLPPPPPPSEVVFRACISRGSSMATQHLCAAKLGRLHEVSIRLLEVGCDVNRAVRLCVTGKMIHRRLER